MEKGTKYSCYYCGQMERCTKDHFYPKSKGGEITVWACSLCQNTKGAKTPTQFLSYVERHVAISTHARERFRNKIQSLIKYIREND
ncbi:HNH endonuclease [Roseivirga seohaensis]|uniref:HNH endonuclease n=1 Tax=Roseivirga seohaensis TaxID=1914963 RepID=UPI003BA91770